MPRKLGSANKKNIQRDTILKIRVSSAFKEEIAKALKNQMFSWNIPSESKFVREAISKHIIYTAREQNLINKDVLEMA